MGANRTVKIYIAICTDHHSDEDVEVFTKPEKAIEYAKNSMPESYDLKEQKLTTNMRRAGWIFLAHYGLEGDRVRVEQNTLNE